MCLGYTIGNDITNVIDHPGTRNPLPASKVQADTNSPKLPEELYRTFQHQRDSKTMT
jgi:hypothetical protein